MALRPTSALSVDPSTTDTPVDESFTFTVDLVDRRAAGATKRTLELFLSPDNDLVFSNGTKVVSQEEKVGAEPVTVTFSRTGIAGPGGDLSSFRVSLRERDGAALVFCMVGLE